MRNVVPCLRSRLLVRVAIVALMAGGVAACSSDTSRFGEDPFSNPFKTSQAPTRHRAPASTGSITAAPTTRIQRAPLGAPTGAASRPTYGYDNGSGGYRSSESEPRSTGSIGAGRNYAQSPAVASGASNWTAQGGTTVTLGQGETVTTISNRYGVPASAILQANNLQNANGVGAGQQLVIPVYSATSRSAALAPVASSPVARPTPSRSVAMAEPASTIAKPRMQLVPGAQPKAVQPLPETRTASIAPKSAPAAEARSFTAAAKPVAAAPQPNDNVKTAALKVDPAPAVAEANGPAFRWPVRGRVISGFGSKSSGVSNDGINLAVPEGTEVKASDDGVVAYAGSDLKDFGNLVLIRHSNGWVTAYAHNSALTVKRGETVRRGQIIAKSGATGRVSSPQLHFEVRQGSKSVDPMEHLPNA